MIIIKKLTFMLMLCLAICFFGLTSCDNTSESGQASENLSDSQTEPLEPFYEEGPGRPDPSSEIVYEERFRGNRLSDDTVMGNIYSESDYAIENGLLTFATDTAHSLAIDIPLTAGGEYRQIEYYIDFSACFGSSLPNDTGATWMACFVGVRLDTVDANPFNEDGGYWLAVLQGRHILVYPSGMAANETWPAGEFEAMLGPGESFFVINQLLIVDTGDELYFYFVPKKSGELSLFLRVEIAGEEIKSYDKDGALLNVSDNYLGKGGYLKLFNHFAETYVEKIVIKGAK